MSARTPSFFDAIELYVLPVEFYNTMNSKHFFRQNIYIYYNILNMSNILFVQIPKWYIVNRFRLCIYRWIVYPEYLWTVKISLIHDTHHIYRAAVILRHWFHPRRHPYIIARVDTCSRRNHEGASRKPRPWRRRPAMPSTGVALQRAFPANGAGPAVASPADDVIAVQQSLSVRPTVASSCPYPRRRPFGFRRARIVIIFVRPVCFFIEIFHSYIVIISSASRGYRLSIFVRFSTVSAETISTIWPSHTDYRSRLVPPPSSLRPFCCCSSCSSAGRPRPRYRTWSPPTRIWWKLRRSRWPNAELGVYTRSVLYTLCCEFDRDTNLIFLLFFFPQENWFFQYF